VPTRRATMRWRSLGAMAPGGSMDVPAGALEELPSVMMQAATAVAANQPDVCRGLVVKVEELCFTIFQ
jgi:hypothetical protein